MPGTADAVCIRSSAAHANKGEKPFDIIFSNLQWSEQMNLFPRLWTTSQELTSDPFRAMRREMANTLRTFDQNSPSAAWGPRAGNQCGGD